MNKILTIIIPTYNMENYLHRCLDSLVVDEKNMMCLEVLVINDGSKDSSLQIAKEYEVKWPNTFRAIDKPNGNYGSCVNRGLDEAKGRYVKILDADDAFYTEAFDKFIPFLMTIDVDMVLTDYNRVDSNDKVLKSTRLNLPESVFSLSEINYRYGLEMHAITYRTQVLKDYCYRQTEGVSYTDAEWSIIPLIKVGSIKYCPIILYRYLIGREGQTINPQIRIKSLWMMRKVFENLLSFYKSNVDNLGEAERIVYHKLLNMSAYIYRIALMFKEESTEAMIEEFDTEIKEKSPSLYNDLNKKSLFRYPPTYYIHDWRNNHNKAYWYWRFFGLYQKAVQVYNIIISK